jgi:hypothetical protein
VGAGRYRFRPMTERAQDGERARNEAGRPSGTGETRFEPDQLAERLREIADRLRSAEIGEQEAESLAREAADLVGRASAEIESDLRAARAEEGP